MVDTIYFYRREDEYGWMSNFWRQSEFVNGIWYKTNEHYYQSQRTINPSVAKCIANAPHAWYAMILGRNLREKDMVKDWDSVKVGIMLTGLRAKFKNKILRDKLLNTGDAIIHENSHTDEFWGCGSEGKGKSMLGKLLMKVREEIRSGEDD